LQKLITSLGPKKASMRRIRVLVLASTRELACQIRESFETYGACTSVRVTAVYGGVGQGSQVRALGHGVDVLVATPGRLMDLMGQGYVDLDHIDTLVLDEADRMLDMGFLPAIRKILEHVPTKRQTLLFSATMPDPIVHLAETILRKPIHISIEPEKKAVDSVEQSVCFVPQAQKIHMLIGMLKELKPQRAIVFTRTKHGAERVVRHLQALELKAESIHSNKSQNKRLRVLGEFKRDNPPVLIATDIAARGIDVDNVSHVFNFDIPHEPETYVHRIGRSGRAGASGIAISFCDSEERKYLRGIEQHIGKRLNVAAQVESAAAEEGTQASAGRGRGDRQSQRGGRTQGMRSQGGRTKGDRVRSDRVQGERRPERSTVEGSAESSAEPRSFGQASAKRTFGKKSKASVSKLGGKKSSRFGSSASGSRSSKPAGKKPAKKKRFGGSSNFKRP
jgi:ATP-dependent RNA helicase RhlE